MQLLSFLVKIMLSPFKSYFKSIIIQFNLKRKHPTLILGISTNLSETQLGVYNYFSSFTQIIKCTIGDYTYIGEHTEIKNTIVGKFTCIGPNVKIGLGMHPSNTFVSVHPIFYSLAAQVGKTFADQQYFTEYDNVQIGNDVWIGANVTIPGGVIVGDGSIIASGAVVTKNVAPYAIVGGVPAKVIKYRFNEQQINELLDLKWWDKHESILKKNFKSMHNINNLYVLKSSLNKL